MPTLGLGGFDTIHWSTRSLVIVNTSVPSLTDSLWVGAFGWNFQ